jgi:hypothetical protein
MNALAFFSPALALQSALESPVEILTRFTGRNIFYALLALAATYLLVRLSGGLLEALARQAPRALLLQAALAALAERHHDARQG